LRLRREEKARGKARETERGRFRKRKNRIKGEKRKRRRGIGKEGREANERKRKREGNKERGSNIEKKGKSEEQNAERPRFRATKLHVPISHNDWKHVPCPRSPAQKGSMSLIS
jgi:hypothetical protein